MDWSKGFSASYYMTIVDPVTWRDIDRIEILDGSISRSRTGLRQSADISCTDFNSNVENWVRIYLDTAQPNSVAHTALFTGLSSVPEQNIDGSFVSFPLTCYSVLKPAEDVLLQKGWFAAAGFNGGDIIEDLLSVIPAPVTIESGSPTLNDHIVAENGENHLTMVDKILTAINWRIRIEGDGSILVCPMPREPVKVLGYDNDVVEPHVNKKADWFSCPNVFRAISGDQMAVARDDDANSLLSTVNRRREIWKEESSCNLNSGESLEQYAERRLQEEQSVAYSVSYTRRYDPDILVGDLVQLHYPEHNLTDIYAVDSQSISLGYGARVSEEVVR